MFDFNWRGILWCMGIAIIAVGGMFVVSEHAKASELNQSYVIIGETKYSGVNPVYRIEQGQEVYINDTIDISGQGWGTGVAWYGKYSEYADPVYIRKFTGFKRDVQLFWLDPSIFEDRWGMWYQYYGTNATERNGNLVAFEVVPGRKFGNTTTFQNGTVISSSFTLTNVTMTKDIPKEIVVPELHITDYLIARGDPLVTNFTRVWLFGRVDGLYDYPGLLPHEQIENFETGSYKLVSHGVGLNEIWETNYDPIKNQITSPWKDVSDVNIAGIQPMLVKDRLLTFASNGDDRFETYNMELQDPEVSIVSIDEVAPGNRYDIRLLEEGTTLLDIRGYTNTANNTELTFVMDPDVINETYGKYGTYSTRAIRTSPGNMSYYRIYIPINKNNMQNGMHTVKVSTAIGGSMYYDFPISELPPDSFVPNASLKYIGNRNPWVPTPTPEVVVKKETVVVTQVVPVQVTPSDAQITDAAKKIVDKQNWETGVISVIGAVLLLVLGFIGWFGYSVWRAKKR